MTTQYLLLWTNIKGRSPGLMVTIIIAFVIIASAFLEGQNDSGRIAWLSLKQMPSSETAGYLTAIFGVIPVGFQQQISAGHNSYQPVATTRGAKPR